MKTQLLVWVATVLTLVGCTSAPQKTARSGVSVAPATSYQELRVGTTPFPVNNANARELEREGWRPVYVRNYTAWAGGADAPASDKWTLEYERDEPPSAPTLEPTGGPLAVWSLATMPNRGLVWGAY